MSESFLEKDRKLRVMFPSSASSEPAHCLFVHIEPGNEVMGIVYKPIIQIYFKGYYKYYNYSFWGRWRWRLKHIWAILFNLRVDDLYSCWICDDPGVLNDIADKLRQTAEMAEKQLNRKSKDGD